MEILITEKVFQNPTAFKKKTDIEVIGHTDTAMHLDGLGSRQVRGLGQLCFCQADQFGNSIATIIQCLQGLDNQGFAHFNLGKQVGGAVLERLETTNRHTKLLALFKVINGSFKCLMCDAQQFSSNTNKTNFEDKLQGPDAIFQ